MANDDNHQYYITIPNSNGETIIITPEILPEQLLPLVQKKQFKEEKVDLSNLTSVYKKFIENLTENNSTSLGSISSLSNIINVNSASSSRLKPNTSSIAEQHKNSDVATNSSSSLLSSRSSLPTILLRHSNINQTNQTLHQSLVSEHSIISGSTADSSNNYITTLQISQGNSNLPALAFSQPQALLHYSNQNSDSPNTVLIPISLHNSNQFPQQQIIVAAAAVASGGYNQSCHDDSGSNALISNPSSHHNLHTTSLAKLISGNVTNPLTINLSNMMKPNSPNSDISPNSKCSASKRKSSTNATDEFGRRKEIRLLKNREAARECRRKKKEYVKCLESRVANLEQQNKVLVDEITRMKELYSKKASKKVAAVQSDIDSNFTTLYQPEHPVKGEYYDITSAVRPTKALTSIASISSSNLSTNLNATSCSAKEISPTNEILRTSFQISNATNAGDISVHSCKKETANASNKMYNSHSIPDYCHQADSKDGAQCDLD